MRLMEKPCTTRNARSATVKMAKARPPWARRWAPRTTTDAKVQDAVTDEKAIKAVKEGYKDKDGKVVMKPAEGLSDDDIKAIVKHLRSFKKA